MRETNYLLVKLSILPTASIRVIITMKFHGNFEGHLRPMRPYPSLMYKRKGDLSYDF